RLRSGGLGYRRLNRRGGTRRRHGGRGRRSAHRRQELRDLLIARVGLEHALVPDLGGGGVARCFRDVAEMPEGDEVFRIERQRRLENGARFFTFAGLEERLSV